MNHYAAIKAKMGSWDYYICKMKMRELAGEVKFASEIYEDRTLDEAIQRELKEGRVRREIVSFLTRRPDRFFSSIVVASLGGNPRFYPVSVTDDPQFAMIADQGLDEGFGILTFRGDQQYYALDGQHRLRAIKTLIEREDGIQPPDGFANEEISVLIIVRQDRADAAFLQEYRRLFSSLNRWARSTDEDTNIIMDEDDPFAILTRRLITDHAFFRWEGRQKESPRIKTKGKNLNVRDVQFTSLQTLYAMNETLLTTARRETGWGPDQFSTSDFRRFRPDEDLLDQLYQELEAYWDGLLAVLPDLRLEPHTMRSHDIEPASEEEVTDHLLFWPIGQELLAKICRRVLNRVLDGDKQPDAEAVADALRPLQYLEWELHRPPWRYFLLTHDEVRGRWRMRNEDRVATLAVGRRIVDWMLGVDDLQVDDIETMNLDWRTRLVPAQVDHTESTMWQMIVSKRQEISKLTS